MKLSVLAVAALLFIPLAPAGAQQQEGRAAAATRIFNWCMRLPTGSESECGCVAGFYAGASADDEYEMIAAFVDFITPEGGISDNDGMIAAVRKRQTEMSMSDERFNEIFQGFATFGELGERADSFCLAVESAASARSSHSGGEQ